MMNIISLKAFKKKNLFYSSYDFYYHVGLTICVR